MKAFLINKSHHDYSILEDMVDEVVTLTTGTVSKLSVGSLLRKFARLLRNSNPEDCLVPSGLNVPNMIAAAIFAAKHGRLNLLIYKKGRYHERNLIIT